MTRTIRGFAAAAIAFLPMAMLSSETARAAAAYGPIATAALEAVGSEEGQCFPWVKRTVFAATGQQIGFDYRDGYLEAGAVEVSASEARHGDIIQIVDDADTSPNADYPGLHTAIILDNLGDGVFRAVDSNWQWDGIVRIRPEYAPALEAARYAGLAVHIYRLPAPVTMAPSYTFAVATEFDENGQAAAIMLDGSIADLVSASREHGATAVWAHDSNGALRVLLVDGPDFMITEFASHFGDQIGPIALTLIAA